MVLSVMPGYKPHAEVAEEKSDQSRRFVGNGVRGQA